MRHLRELTRLDSAPVVSEPAVRRRVPPAVVGAGSSGLSADHPTSFRTGCTAGRPVRPRKAKAPGLAGSPRPTSWHACRTPGRWRRSSPRWCLATRASLKGSSWYRRARPLPVPRHRRPGARGDHPQRPAARERARPLRARRFLPHARWARLPLRPPPRRSSGAGGGRAGDPQVDLRQLDPVCFDTARWCGTRTWTAHRSPCSGSSPVRCCAMGQCRPTIPEQWTSGTLFPQSLAQARAGDQRRQRPPGYESRKPAASTARHPGP